MIDAERCLSEHRPRLLHGAATWPIVLNIQEEDIERIARSLDNQYAYTLARNLEDSGYKRLADLFRGLLKRGSGQATSLCDQMEVPSKEQSVRQKRGR